MHMRRVLGLLLGLAFLQANQPSSAQALWGGVEYGMSMQQVMQVIPQAKPITDAPTHVFGAAEKLRIDRFVINEKEFRVSFYFKKAEVLQEIQMHRKEPSWAVAMLTFEDFSRAMEVKYGPPRDRKDYQSPPLRIRSVEWQMGKSNIVLQAMGLEGKEIALDVAYQARVADAVDKL